MTFPKDFIWGAATASYQVEGAAREDGRGESIWDRFSHTPGKVKNGDTGDVACDHYHRYKEDVALMTQLGLDAYRFSIAWARILPSGTGAVNPAGVDFYDRLVDELLAHNITPYATLYHWDLPQKLQDRGGWANPDSVKWFVDYATTIANRLGDRVKHWSTHNEPWVVAHMGHLLGTFAPGIQDPTTAYQVAHHLLISHGEAVRAVQGILPDAKLGITLNMEYAIPATESEADKAAAYRYAGFFNRWFSDPVFKGAYPQDMVELLGKVLDPIDLDAISAAKAPIDFLGVNYYTCKHVADTPPGEGMPLLNLKTIPNPNATYTDMHWEICPEGLTELLRWVHQEYAPPAIYVTENGSSYIDPVPNGSGIVEDPKRTAYLQAHLAALEPAIADGVPLKGYFAWSLLDNFEWAEGYSCRFGIIYVDYETQQRTLKRTALTYQAHIASQRQA